MLLSKFVDDSIKCLGYRAGSQIEDLGDLAIAKSFGPEVETLPLGGCKSRD